MTHDARPRETRRTGARILDTAEGVLVALRRYRLDEAFVEIMHTAKRHNVDAVNLAHALVTLAEDQHGRDIDDAAAAVALSTWGQLFRAGPRGWAHAEPGRGLPAEDV
ncbi:hypothetical protein [Mycobacterium botniense]|uniref:ANTAR domain-containing protein n=1 Tax=Mycobacterium botniense TaxID=84962 RepID=A0A7I9XS74_9MYCO|nr:hypothetical protein [Mycobacterium botniense]GFG72845.1 hypothetical protein MBOT_02100 [Mycobacterium botniense]